MKHVYYLYLKFTSIHISVNIDKMTILHLNINRVKSWRDIHVFNLTYN